MEPGSQHRPIERVVASIAIAIAIAAAAAPAGASEIPFAAGWELSGPSIAVVDGVLEAGNGRAVRREARLQDGTISFDLQLSGARSFVFIELRAEDDESYGAPPGADQWAVLARTTIEADRELLRRLELGWSDEVSVFLNGRLLFAADASYSFDRPRREGLIGFEQAALYLPLRRGANELVLAVTDRFGGWGWMARLP